MSLELVVGVTLFYLRALISAAIISSLLYWIGSSWAGIEYGPLWAWERPATVLAGLGDVYYIFIWGAVVMLLVGGYHVIRQTPRTASPKDILTGGFWISADAAIFEELIWRWLVLLGIPVVLKALDFITFGLMHWVYSNALIPFANWTTFGILEPQLTSPNWLFAASILCAGAAFGKQHEHLGPLGQINSWFLGMVFFYLVFNHGIIAAMIAHFMYDMIIFGIGALSAALRPRDHLWELRQDVLRALSRRNFWTNH